MHAIAAGKVTCAAMGCSQPGTVEVIRIEPPTSCGCRDDGSEVWTEHTPALVDYCEKHAERLCL